MYMYSSRDDILFILSTPLASDNVVLDTDLLGLDFTSDSASNTPVLGGDNRKSATETTPQTSSWMDSELLELEAETKKMPKQASSSRSPYDWLVKLAEVSSTVPKNDGGASVDEPILKPTSSSLPIPGDKDFSTTLVSDTNQPSTVDEETFDDFQTAEEPTLKPTPSSLPVPDEKSFSPFLAAQQPQKHPPSIDDSTFGDSKTIKESVSKPTPAPNNTQSEDPFSSLLDTIHFVPSKPTPPLTHPPSAFGDSKTVQEKPTSFSETQLAPLKPTPPPSHPPHSSNSLSEMPTLPPSSVPSSTPLNYPQNVNDLFGDFKTVPTSAPEAQLAQPTPPSVPSSKPPNYPQNIDDLFGDFKAVQEKPSSAPGTQPAPLKPTPPPSRPPLKPTPPPSRPPNTNDLLSDFKEKPAPPSIPSSKPLNYPGNIDDLFGDFKTSTATSTTEASKPAPPQNSPFNVDDLFGDFKTVQGAATSSFPGTYYGASKDTFTASSPNMVPARPAVHVPQNDLHDAFGDFKTATTLPSVVSAPNNNFFPSQSPQYGHFTKLTTSQNSVPAISQNNPSNIGTFGDFKDVEFPALKPTSSSLDIPEDKGFSSLLTTPHKLPNNDDDDFNDFQTATVPSSNMSSQFSLFAPPMSSSVFVPSATPIVPSTRNPAVAMSFHSMMDQRLYGMMPTAKPQSLSQNPLGTESQRSLNRQPDFNFMLPHQDKKLT